MPTPDGPQPLRRGAAAPQTGRRAPRAAPARGDVTAPLAPQPAVSGRGSAPRAAASRRGVAAWRRLFPSLSAGFSLSVPPCAAPCSGWRSRRGSRSQAGVVGFRTWRPWGILMCSAPASRPPRWSSPCPAGTTAARGRPARWPRGCPRVRTGEWAVPAVCRGRDPLAPGLSAWRAGAGAALGAGLPSTCAARCEALSLLPRRARGSYGSPAAGRAGEQPGLGGRSAAARWPRTGRAAGGARGRSGGSRSGCGRHGQLLPRILPGTGDASLWDQSGFSCRYLTSGAVPSAAGWDGENSHPEE